MCVGLDHEANKEGRKKYYQWSFARGLWCLDPAALNPKRYKNPIEVPRLGLADSADHGMNEDQRTTPALEQGGRFIIRPCGHFYRPSPSGVP